MNVHIITEGDNYVYVLVNAGVAAAIDPCCVAPIVRVLDSAGARLAWALVTHGHHDHNAGCTELKRITGCRIAAPAGGATPLDREVADGDTVDAGPCAFTVLSVPGHTESDVAYYCAAENLVFTGDTLFAGGCGRPFADPSLMWDSLRKLRSLPDDTGVYCGHDYTVDNVDFAAHMDVENDAIRARLKAEKEKARAGLPTVPSTIGLEKTTNPFFRCSTLAEFVATRAKKNRWG